ncbi:hypothetical protein Q5752_001038 [Cryptotrichosporon argae]
MSASDDEDATDIFDTALSALFSVPPIAFSTASPSTPYTYTPPASSLAPGPIELRLPQPPAAVHVALQANHLWLAAVYLADRISTGALTFAPRQDVTHRPRIAELGAAAGLPGIVACRLDAEVVSTDWDADEVISVLRANFSANCGPPASRSSSTAAGSDEQEEEGERATGSGHHWQVVGHCWGSDPAPVLSAGTGGTYDAVLLADTLWVTDAHAALLDSVARLTPGGLAHVAAGLHTGRGPVERFLDSARARGCAVRKVDEVRWQVGGGWAAHGAETAGLEEERGVVVYYTLQVPS